MCAYSSVNGSFSCEDRYLFTDTLKASGTSPGSSPLTTERSTTPRGDSRAPTRSNHSTPTSARRCRPACNSGTIPRAVLNTMVQRILTEMFRFNLFSRASCWIHERDGDDAGARRGRATRSPQDCTTLLKNSGGTLPLSAGHAGTVAVIGPSAAASPTNAGGGSVYVIPSGRSPRCKASSRQRARATAHRRSRRDCRRTTSLAAIPASAISPAYSGGTAWAATTPAR